MAEPVTWPQMIDVTEQATVVPVRPGSALLVTEDVVRAGRVAQAVGETGLLVSVAFSLAHGLRSLHEVQPQLVLLDLGRTMSGASADIARVRSATVAPLLVLVRAGTVEVCSLLRAGASAVAAVDADPRELAAQAEALVGLSTRWVTATGRITWGPVVLDVGTRAVTVGGVLVAVTPLQFRLLNILLSARGDVVSHATLYRLLWRCSVDDDGQRLAAHIHRLRVRLSLVGAEELVITLRGEGYRVADADAAVRPDRPPVGVGLQLADAPS
jgi:DNA-binding response OmpR family regulator